MGKDFVGPKAATKDGEIHLATFLRENIKTTFLRDAFIGNYQ
jgi:hypothetical protein